MPESGLTFSGIEKELLARFPELRDGLEQSFGFYYDLASETPEAYPVFEDVLQKLVLQLLRTGEEEALLGRIFTFLEEMANSGDRDVTDLLGIAILEPLTFERDAVRRAWGFMGERTRRLARETARYGGWLDNLPPDGPTGNEGRTGHAAE